MASTSQLSFGELRSANLRRLPEFKNSQGATAHTKKDGSDWSPSQWFQAMAGEVGEYANIRKKFERGDIDLQEFHRLARRELADIATYLDLLAFQIGVDLGEAVVEKFNEVSDRVGSSVKL